MSTVLFADAVDVVLSRLKAALPTLTFVHKTPTTRPLVYTRVLRTGGPRTNLVVDGAQLTFESYAPTDDVAMANAQLVRAHLNALPEQFGVTPAIYKVEEFSGPGNLVDPVSQSPRATWTSVVSIRGSST